MNEQLAQNPTDQDRRNMVREAATQAAANETAKAQPPDRRDQVRSASATADAGTPAAQQQFPQNENRGSTGAECARTPGVVGMVFGGLAGVEQWLRKRKNERNRRNK